MSATDPRPAAQQLALIKGAAMEAYNDVKIDDVTSYLDDRGNMSFNAARHAVGIDRGIEAAAPALTAHGLEHAAEFLRTRDTANMHPAAVQFAEWVAEEFAARAAALTNGEYEVEEQA